MSDSLEKWCGICAHALEHPTDPSSSCYSCKEKRNFEKEIRGGSGMSHNEQLYEAAKEAITALFSDTSVPRSTAKENLETLKDEIDDLLSALESDEADEVLNE
jgi:hypothetical protein